MERSKTILTRLAPETERWGWLLLLDVEEDLQYDVYLITRDSTCADVTYNKTEAVEIVKRFQQLREITMDLKRALECNRLRWLRGQRGDEIERERIERKSVDVIVGVLDPLLKVLEQQVKKWERVRGKLRDSEAREVKETFSNITRDYLFWACHLNVTYSKFTRG